jgi:hypothetical protein
VTLAFQFQDCPRGKRQPRRAAGIPTLLFVLIVFAGCDRGAAVIQPVGFNHQAHTDSGLDCTFCHESVENAAYAGVPTTDLCVGCHEGGLTESEEEQKVLAYAERGEPVPWRRIYQVPDHVYFSHRRHVAVAEIECVECHGRVPDLTVPASRPLVEQTMDWCLQCHEARGASTDCIHCHV